MALTPGTRLGAYEIQSPLGAGGMGEVYKARDTRLDRTVAVKVLPEHVASDPDLKQRFEREAKTLAALSHPHICPVYDVGSQDGIDFLVMEHLEGETLAQRLSKGALPLDQAIRIAIDTADALDKAHRAGIVHRDLKPGNIMLVRRRGASGPPDARLLDFGLAKTRPAVVTGANASMLPTTPRDLTAYGTILGTLQYMAPEQIEGQDADARTDIFAFGAVVYEMVTGKKAFEGKSPASVIAAILKDEPAPIGTLQPLLPASLDRIVATCLAKEPDDRWQSARDLRRAFEWMNASPSGSEASKDLESKPVSKRWQYAATLVLAICVTAGVTAITVLRLNPAPPVMVSRAVIPAPTPELLGVDNGPLALSPDGRRLVYAARDKLYLRPLDSLTATPIPGTEDGGAPFFSPDGEWVAFFATGQLKKVSIRGGPPIVLCAAAGGPLSGSWGSDDRIVFSPRGGTDGLLEIPSAGGTPQPLIRPDRNKQESTYFWPQRLPGSDAVMFTVQADSSEAPTQIVALSLKTGDRRVLVQGGTSARYLLSGHLVYMNGGTLMAVPFDVRRLEVSGTPIPVVEGVAYSPSGAGMFSVSATGSLVFVQGGLQENTSQFVWVDRNGAIEPIGTPVRPYGQFSLSPDGQRVAVDIGRDIWTVDLVRKSLTRLTFGGSLNRFPVWMPDGQAISYQSNKGGVPNIVRRSADGGGSEETVTEAKYAASPDAWSPDGNTFVFHEQHQVTSADLWLMPKEDYSKAHPVLQTRATEEEARISSDGRWLAYLSNESGRFEVYVQSFPDMAGKWQISTEGGMEPLWSPDSQELYFTNGTKTMAVAIKADSTLTAGTPRVLFEGQFRPPTLPVGYSAIAPDGRHFLKLQPVKSEQPPATEINIVLNWSEELKRLVPTK